MMSAQDPASSPSLQRPAFAEPAHLSHELQLTMQSTGVEDKYWPLVLPNHSVHALVSSPATEYFFLSEVLPCVFSLAFAGGRAVSSMGVMSNLTSLLAFKNHIVLRWYS
jgi:hypothetical protein